jgi:hypothetical protein
VPRRWYLVAMPWRFNAGSTGIIMMEFQREAAAELARSQLKAVHQNNLRIRIHADRVTKRKRKL